MQAAYEAELKAEQEAAEQAEFETNSNNSDAEEAVEANPTTEYSASGEFHSSGLFSDYIDGVQHEPGFYYNHSSELNEDEDEDAGCKIWTDEDGSFTKEFNSFVNENRGPPQRVETATEPLEPLCEYFNTKLSDSDDLYRFSDMIMEVNGMCAQIFFEWTLPPKSSAPLIDLDSSGCCSHNCKWSKGFNVPECGLCHFWNPVYTMTCTSCGTIRCICCRF